MIKPPNERDLIRIEGEDRPYDRRKVLAVLLMPLAMALMAVSSTNVALPTIQGELGASDADLQWILAGYTLVYGIALVPAGRAGDLLGRGRLFVIGVALFTAASLACGLSWHPGTLIACRVAQGIGSALLSPQITGMITQYFSGTGRARAFSLFGVVVAASVAVGPLITGGIIGALGPTLGWRASFILNVLVGLLTIVLAARWFPFDTEKHRRAAKAAGTESTRRLDLDPIGALLLAAAVFSFMLPFIVQRPLWFLLVLVGAGLLRTWVWWEARYRRLGHDPMVDLDLFRFRSFTYSTAISAIQFIAGPSVFVVLALYTQRDLGVSALGAGLIGLPNALTAAFVSSRTGRHALTIGRTLVVAAQASIVVGVSTAAILVGILGERVPLWSLAVALMFMGMGQGVMGSVNQTLALAEVPTSFGGVAGGVKQTGERVSTAMSQAIFPGIFFGATGLGWSVGFIRAYAAIAATTAVALVLAIIDRSSAGPGVPVAKRT